MAPVVLLVLILAMVGGSDGAWCVCKQEASSSALQKTIDYACGAGADCNPILQKGPCFNPNTVIAHCSYAANSYYQRHGQNPQACDFAGAAVLTNSDPSQPGCTYPASPSAAGTSNTPTSTGGVSFPPPGSSTAPGGGAGTFNPNSGGSFGSLGPTGAGLDGNAAAGLLQNAYIGSSRVLPILLSALAFAIDW